MKSQVAVTSNQPAESLLQQAGDIALMALKLADAGLGKLSKGGLLSEPAAEQVRQTLADLVAQSATQASSVVSASLNDALESILATVGPGDPFASLPILSASSLKPGDIIVRCTPGLSSQLFEFALWTRYSHGALYIGEDKIIDATGKGVKIRELSELLRESNRVGVLRVPDLTEAQAQAAISAARSQEGAAYNYEGVVALLAQKLAALIAYTDEGIGGVINILSRTERLPDSLVNQGTYGCTQLVRFAFQKAGITLSHANGLNPGDVVRLGLVGDLNEVGRLPLSASAPVYFDPAN